MFLDEWFDAVGREEPFFSLPYARTPRPPVIFRWVEGRYRPATRSFRGFLENERNVLSGDTADASELVQFVAVSVLIGHWPTARARFEGHPELVTLDRIAGELESRLE